MLTVEVVVERADGSGQTIREVALEPSLVIPADTLHYIGGSNTWMAVEGYHRVPGNAGAFIPSWHSGGGSLWRWSAGISDYRVTSPPTVARPPRWSGGTSSFGPGKVQGPTSPWSTTP